MKTNILKWDYYLQLGLGALNLAGLLFYWHTIYVLLALQAIIGLYQLCSNSLHIFLEHKSVGYFQWRQRHLSGSAGYVFLLLTMGNLIPFNSFWFFLLVVTIPQLVIYSYVLLCKKELDFIEHREFHILK